jgi:hypothetical protein
VLRMIGQIEKKLRKRTEGSAHVPAKWTPVRR